MDETQVISLALLQGLTEFLPISSSAHLILLPVLFGWSDQGLAFDVAVHLGSLGAVVAYFRHDLHRISGAWVASLRGRPGGADARLAWFVIAGTIPVALFGGVLTLAGDAWLRSPLVIAVTTLVFALALWWSERIGRQERDEGSLRWRDVVIIGCAQAIALIPGTSRSGITITAGLALGMTRASAARFSFLLSIPVICLAGLLKTIEAWTLPGEVAWGELAVGALIAGASAYLCIHLFLRWVERIGLLPFVIYRLVLGVVLLAMVL